MKLTDFDYALPKNLIAQQPLKPRDRSRLLVLDRNTGKMEHGHFYDIINYLKAGDVLVLNNTKVMPARLIGKKAGTGGRVEVFLLKKIPPLSLPLIKGEKYKSPLPPLLKGAEDIWQCLVGGKKRKDKLKVEFAKGLKTEIIKNNLDGTWSVKFNKSGAAFMKVVEKIGQVPLPPYIKRRQDSIGPLGPMPTGRQEARGLRRSLQNDRNSYQTVYADDAKLGSVAAPTAGFHFTKKLISQLKKKGVQFEYVALQVGLGTFAPVKVDDITKHKMHVEWIETDKNTLRRIVKAKLEGRRVIAVGTTSVRMLESVFKNFEIEDYLKIKNFSFWTDIFIYPGYKFKIIDALITNFHLPKSTLLMLVSAFACTEPSRSAGRKKIFKAYQTAIKKKYRFYSYGDAMLIY